MTRAMRRSIALAALCTGAGLVACGDGGDGGGFFPPPPMTLTAVQKAALDEALQDAYRTYYAYDVAVDELGTAEPFTTIVSTELAQSTTLTTLYADYNATPPASKWGTGNVERFANREQACMAAEEGEVATEMMFERLLRLNLPSDLRGAFTSLRETARNQHRLSFRNCVGGTVSPLTAQVQAGVEEALQDEFRAFHTYDRVLTDLGSAAPFTTIRDAEWQHVGAAANLLVKRGLTVPMSVASADNVPRYGTVAAGCAAAVDGELANVMMYDRLLEQTLPRDVERVFQNLRESSLERHLSAFQACGGASGEPLTAAVIAAMDEAIQDEYRAHFTYKGVVEDIEPDFPFGPISDAEESHYTAIANLYLKRALAVPASTWSLANVARFGTLQEACAGGVTAEIANIAMYDRLLLITMPADVKFVFEKLRAASNDRHLPAFQACD